MRKQSPNLRLLGIREPPLAFGEPGETEREHDPGLEPEDGVMDCRGTADHHALEWPIAMLWCARAFTGDTGPIDIGDSDCHFTRAQLVTGGVSVPVPAWHRR